MPSSQTLLLSPAELSYLHSSLSSTPPLRPDGRTTTQFRPLIAETALLPSTNGSARVCWSEGEECIVGVKAEVERTSVGTASSIPDAAGGSRGGSPEWVSLSIEIPGFRDDDALPVFLGSMLHEALVQSGFIGRRLVINARWHWRIYIDILLLSPPLSYPLPLLSITTHLALLDTKLPRLVSEGEEDPLFDDDWAAAIALYSNTPLSGSTTITSPAEEENLPPYPPLPASEKPPITLLITSISTKILFDPSREEIAVADAILAVSLAASTSGTANASSSDTLLSKKKKNNQEKYSLLSIRTIDPPSRLTPRGLPDTENPATNNMNINPNPNSNSSSSTLLATKPAQSRPLSFTQTGKTSGSTAGATSATSGSKRKEEKEEGVWTPPLGGMNRTLIGRVVAMCIGDESQGVVGVAKEVFDGLEGFVVGG